jgi:hypothetical protein
MTSRPDHLPTHQDRAPAASEGSVVEHAASAGPPADDLGPRTIGLTRREIDLRWRAVVLSVLAGVVAGLICGVVEQPRYRGLAEVQVSAERGSAARIAREHADALLSDGAAEHWQGSPAVEQWRAARAARDVTVRVLPQSGNLELALDTPDRALAETLPGAAVSAYIAYVNTLPLEHFRSPGDIEWSERQTALAEELQRRRTRRQEIEARLARTPLVSERSDVQIAFNEALDGFDQVVERLRRLRPELKTLQSQELPRGEVTTEVYQRGLAEDTLYQEDLQEHASEARQYRAELAVALTLLVDPLEGLGKTVQDLSATIVEQRDLQPPPNVRTLLEQCLADTGDLERSLTEFAQGWGQRREMVERLRASEQVVELVEQQGQALDAAGRLVIEARRVSREVHTRIDALGAEGNAGTREIVVVNALRRVLSRVDEQVDVLAEAATAINPSTNFRLDVHDRQLRGLRTRLRDREERIRQVLQADADRAARAERDAHERRLRDAIDASDDERQALMDTLVANLRRLRELDEQHRELGELNAELKVEEAAIGRLTKRLELLEAERPALRRDVLTLVGSRCERTAGHHRLRDAGLLGVATMVVTGLLFLLLFVRVRVRPIVAVYF